MSGELIRLANRDTRPRMGEMALARDARSVHDEVRLSALKIDGAVALAGRAMEGIAALDEQRRQLSGTDPLVNEMLARLQVKAFEKATSIQSQLYSGWRL